MHPRRRHSAQQGLVCGVSVNHRPNAHAQPRLHLLMVIWGVGGCSLGSAVLGPGRPCTILIPALIILGCRLLKAGLRGEKVSSEKLPRLLRLTTPAEEGGKAQTPRKVTFLFHFFSPDASHFLFPPGRVKSVFLHTSHYRALMRVLIRATAHFGGRVHTAALAACLSGCQSCLLASRLLE